MFITLSRSHLHAKKNLETKPSMQKIHNLKLKTQNSSSKNSDSLTTSLPHRDTIFPFLPLEAWCEE
uniref:Uncharacterized protein n=1 Tax=Oryza brachyantha TaxID=4533 RepID=J3NDH8_ORYBR